MISGTAPYFFSQICIHQGIPFSLTTRPHLDLSNTTMEEIKEQYADRILNRTTQPALEEKPSKKKFKSSSAVLKSLKS